MDKGKAIGIVVLSVVCCAVMALVETVVEPAYFVKSATQILQNSTAFLNNYCIYCTKIPLIPEFHKKIAISASNKYRILHTTRL